MADGSSIPFDQDDGNSTRAILMTLMLATPLKPLARLRQTRRRKRPPRIRRKGAVPPGYDWPTHGGYLGCLLSLIASCLIGGFLGTTLFAALGYSHGCPQGRRGSADSRGIPWVLPSDSAALAGYLASDTTGNTHRPGQSETSLSRMSPIHPEKRAAPGETDRTATVRQAWRHGRATLARIHMPIDTR